MRVKVEYERDVMNTVLACQIIHDARGNTSGPGFNEIAGITNIPKGSLHYVLKRLAKRGWVKHVEDWDTRGINKGIGYMYQDHLKGLKRTRKTSKPGDYPDVEYKVEIYEEAVKANPKAKDKFRGLSRVKPDIINEVTPKKHAGYVVLGYPFIFGSTYPPEGTKRFWKSAANELKTILRRYLKQYYSQFLWQYVIGPTVEFETIKEGKVTEEQIPISELPKNKQKLFQQYKDGKIDKTELHRRLNQK